MYSMVQPIFWSFGAADTFKKTIYNTLEELTKKKFTRKNYKYFYNQPVPIPPTFELPADQELGKRKVVFLELTNKKTDAFVKTIQSNWKSNCVWIKIKDIDPQYKQNVYGKLYPYVSDIDVILTQWPKAKPVLEQLGHAYQQSLDKPLRIKRERDLESALTKEAQGSWFTFERAVYFNKNTPVYKVLSLEDTSVLFAVDGEEYASLAAYLDKNGEEGVDNLQVLEKGIKAKLNNPGYRKVLLSTGKLPLIYAAKNSAFYGIGANGKGYNHLGRMLMTMREDIDNPPHYTRNDNTLFNLQRSQPQVYDVTATARLLWYRTTSRLPSFKAPKPGSVARKAQERDKELRKQAVKSRVGKANKRVKPMFGQESKPLIDEPQEGESLTYTSDGNPVQQAEVRRRIVKQPETKEEMKARLMQQVTGTPEDIGTGVGLPRSEKKNQ